MTGDRTRPDLRALLAAKGFRTWISDGWEPADDVVEVPPGTAEAAAAHRGRLSAELPGQRIALAAGRAVVRSNDTFHGFRADSDFVWLTGCQREGAILVMTPAGDSHHATLYVPRPAEAHEPDFVGDADTSPLWVGSAAGPAAYGDALGIECRPLEDLPHGLRGRNPSFLVGAGVDPALDGYRFGHSERLRTVLAELRRIKDDWEIGQLRDAVDATALGFADVLAALPEAVRGGGERWLQGTFDRRARTEGTGPGYTSIVAAGPHAPILHWTRCDGKVTEDSLLLLDAGVEVDSLYTADITRTFPVGGEFTKAQRDVYDLVHKAHVAALGEVRPGQDYGAFQATALRVLAEGLHDWGLLPVSVDEALSPDGQQHRRYIVCGTGHFLGLDVHDCAAAHPSAYREGTLAEGMALAVEPGLYFHAGDRTVPPELRGLGVRIEDDVVVTGSGYDLLSGGFPSTADEITAWVQAARG
ncbi:Xaa-Pro aminopeptidase [Amycolatopsis sp. WAC 04169]|uniref:aminopeptidase P family protein n=1 Tax=Amycolatopsis sp. WAC 04169 TaxID=2203197 RepID=UPI000F79AFD1|nr:aminopeptidase P family protein [Amycolatopsis sp. WAC 04169]RSN28835.1 Xaa-Pro aminopeptidase [Amycolatopsis sp. WAC 04169]